MTDKPKLSCFRLQGMRCTSVAGSAADTHSGGRVVLVEPSPLKKIRKTKAAVEAETAKKSVDQFLKKEALLPVEFLECLDILKAKYKVLGEAHTGSKDLAQVATTILASLSPTVRTEMKTVSDPKIEAYKKAVVAVMQVFCALTCI